MDDRTAIRLEVLPARLGDCLLVECLREKGAPWRMLVDGGPPDTWPLLEARLADDPRIDVAVITHIDSDHIGGMIPYLGSPMAASIGDVWFNGRNHLPGPRQRSVAQGESVMTTLLGVAEQGGRATGSLPWNLAFGGGPLDTGEEAGFVEHVVPDGPRITLLSPTTKRLQALAATWHHAVREATRGEEETEVPDVLVPLTDLAAIAAEKTTKDGSLPNGSSIALLLEHRGASVVLGADAFGTVLGAGLTGLAAHRGVTTLPVDAFKLPHHGSKGNVLEALLKIAPAQHYVVSSNGDTFHHPDDQAVARVVMHAPRGATLWFNYRNPRTERWADPDLRARHGYRTAYPEDPARGVVLELPGKGAMTQLPWPATHSLVREELLDVPTTVYGDQRIDGPLQALVAGEPQRALALLATQPPDPRSAVVLTAWARQLDRNWYPGDVGAETAVATPDAFVEPQPGDHPIALQLAMLVRRGPPDLRVQRTLMEMSLRAGASVGVQEALGYAAESVNLLTQYAAQTGQQALLPWLTLVRADFSRRAGLQQDADVLLAQARQQASMLPSPPRLALTYLVEGDWYAAPGASPEGLGWDLAPQNKANPLPPRDLRRAAALWDQAEAQLAGWDVLRLRATLALRRGWQARLAGVPDVQRQYLAVAKDLFLRAGDRASYHLAVVHELVADIEDGRLGQHQLQLGGGWSPPQHGPVAELLQWAATVGSRSWCVGLGRLLQRCGDRWVAEGSAPRARVAYLAALPLVSSDPAVPARALQTAVAHVDGRLSLAVNALLRLDRTFRSPGPAGGNEDLAFSELLDGSASMIGALRDRTRGAAAGITADRMQRLRDDLETARAHTAARLGPSPEGPLPRTLAELEAEVARLQGDGALQTAAEGARHAMGVMVHMNLEMAVSQIVLLDVLIATTRAEAAERAGVRAEAERWYAEARERAVLPGADPFLPTLVELSAGRMDAAAAALALAGDQVSDDLQFPLWVQIGDVERAVATLARLHAAGMPLSDWRSRLSIAELRLAQGDAAAARDEVRQAVEVFAGAVGALLRDPDRLDACDQPDVAALFSVRARASLALGDHLDSLVAAEEARQLVAREREAAVDESAWTEWQRAAAEYASVSHTVLARLAAAPSQEVATFTGLDDADRRLAEAEQTLDQRQPGILLRRAAPPPPPSVPDLQARLPEGAVCLEYLAVGEDFFGWAVTRDALVPSRQPVRYRDLSVMVRSFHAGCSFGRAPDDDLSALLLTPFADLLRTHERVVVVPFAALNLVPFHALSLDGAPLGLSHVVSYAPSLAAAVGGAGLEGAVDLTRPLVVGDPAFDRAARPQLRPLPGSRLEAETVATFLDVQDPLIGDAATEPAVTGRLEDCTLMHISSHGHLDELSPFSSSLVMAGDDELTVAELVGLRFGTSLAVLTGCDTGRGNATLGGDVVGLTRSLLRGGVGQVVVSLWPVDDWVAPVTMQRFYEALRKGLPTAYALTEAQRSVHALDAEALRAAYVAMGGGSDDAQRRGVDLDPELRDDEEPEAPLGGDAERFWAPFVLVG